MKKTTIKSIIRHGITWSELAETLKLARESANMHSRSPTRKDISLGVAFNWHLGYFKYHTPSEQVEGKFSITAATLILCDFGKWWRGWVPENTKTPPTPPYHIEALPMSELKWKEQAARMEKSE